MSINTLTQQNHVHIYLSQCVPFLTVGQWDNGTVWDSLGQPLDKKNLPLTERAREIIG